ncbi:hypothetical protein F2Q69_00023178 [Brassica cretica]|uniref:Uncharacterized protein n=1 Tax=Brassica cretica TaxID=69181 RepID=A0A8S9QMC7_BRACR|nr:hypothetical protein F2Q69_00023178 [Brassica cretica]
MEGSPYQKFSIFRRKGSDPKTEPGKRHSGEPGFLPAGILGTGVPSSGDPEAGVLPGVWRNSIPEYFPQQFAPYCSISSSNLGNNLCTQVNRSRNRILNPGDDQVSPASDRGLVLFTPLILVEDGELWASDDVLETVEPRALIFPEEELA